MILKVRHAMVKPVTVDAEETVLEAARRMIQENQRYLVVLQGNELRGVVDLYKVFRYTYSPGFRPQQTPIGELVDENIVLARPETSLEDALTIMVESNCDALPVVDEGLVGVVDIYGVLKAQPKARPKEKSVYMA